jgi:hypothetical protein
MGLAIWHRPSLDRTDVRYTPVRPKTATLLCLCGLVDLPIHRMSITEAVLIRLGYVQLQSGDI